MNFAHSSSVLDHHLKCVADPVIKFLGFDVLDAFTQLFSLCYRSFQHNQSLGILHRKVAGIMKRALELREERLSTDHIATPNNSEPTDVSEFLTTEVSMFICFINRE